MDIVENQLKLVELALSGHKDSLNQLAEIVQAPLRSYVLRITYKKEITDDIVQETLLEMFKIFKQLKQADHFWPWLCKIAFNKVLGYSQVENRHRELLKNHAEKTTFPSYNIDGLASAINKEFQQAIAKSVSFLSDRQRAVLTMRCYENMSYSQIAEVMDLSELGCRLLFVRARKKLQHKLFRLGYGQKSLLTALILLGKLTAPSEAAAAEVCVTPAMLSGGVIATGIAMVTSKTALILAAGGVVAVGAVTMTSHSLDLGRIEPAMENVFVTSVNAPANSRTHINEGYYLFPQGKQGSVLTRLMLHEGNNTIQKLQNDTGNYSYCSGQQVVTINNHHYWKSDLSVMSLPTDNAELESFLAQTEHRKSCSHTIEFDATNLFVVVSGEAENQNISFAVKHYEALMEERFQYNWPARAGVQDNRDALHQQGWCYFTMKGQLHDESITGSGRLPFVYSKAIEQPAWLKVTIANKLTLIDTPSGAVMLDAANLPVSTYQAGTFLGGLNRPWGGLHVIDTVRRDAALSHISFKTGLNADGTRGLVSLQVAGGKIEYVIDMKNDLIEQISFFDTTDKVVGEILFEYLNPNDFSSDEFRIPQLPSNTSSQRTEQLHWLSALAANNL